MREPSASAASAAEILDRLGGRWAFIGAIAALRYRATPRFTTDVDVLAEAVPGLAEAFFEAGYDVDVIAEPGEPPHLILVRGKGSLDRAVDHVIRVEDVILDTGYIERWAKEWDVLDRWHEALASR